MGRRRGFGVGLSVVALLLLTGCDWAGFGFDAANTSDNAYEPAITTASVAHLSAAWSQPCVCLGRALVRSGVVYAVDSSTRATAVSAFSAATGSPRWSHPSADGTRLMAIGNGLVYLIVGRSVVALDAATGAVRWTVLPVVPGSGVVTVSHLVVDGTEAFVEATEAIANGDPVSEVSALDESGRVIWSTTPGGQVGGFAGVPASSQPDSTARVLEVVSVLQTENAPYLDFVITRYDEQGGELSHRVVVGIDLVGADAALLDDVSASDGLVYFLRPSEEGEDSLCAVDPITGALVWRGPGNRSYALGHDVVAAVSSNRFIRSVNGLNSRTGQTLWGPVPGADAPAIAGPVLFTTAAGALEARDLATGAVVGSFQPVNDTLVGLVTPADGRIYVGSGERLYAVAPATGSR